MLFNSWIFIVFFIVTCGVFLGMIRTRFWLHWLLIASYFFYGWLNPLYVVLIVYTTVVTYFSGMRIENSSGKKIWLLISILNNILVLGFFKYAGFASENLNALLHFFNFSLVIPQPGFLLPVGLSFYTFIAAGYSIDVYRGTISAERNIIRFAAFVSFFPYLLAGPIERAHNMLPQFKTTPTIRMEHITEGLSLFVVGLFKKIALADFLALYVAKVYGNPSEFQGLASLMATYAFAWQIYFDFSGYTDMARGCARILGFNLMLNFDNPYLASGLGEFWRRWHISLSCWFRDYLYIPLGGNRKGKLNTYRNMILTMLVAGLWHGAAWNFVIWGGLHALGRCVTRELESTRFYRDRLPKILKQLIVFHYVCVTWIFFRAETFGKAVTILKGIFSFPWTNPQFSVVALLFIAGIWLYQFVYESRFRKITELSAVKTVLMLSMILYMIFFRTSGYEVFIYFRF